MVLAAPALALAALLLAAPPAEAGESTPANPPDSTRLAAATARCGPGSLVRVRTGETTLLVRDPQFSEAGIAGFWDGPEWANRSVTSFAPERRMVTWDRIARIEKSGNWSPLGAKLGFTLGMALGFAAAATIDRPGTDYVEFGDYGGGYAAYRPASQWTRAAVLVWTPLICTGAGALAGALVPHWTRIAP